MSTPTPTRARAAGLAGSLRRLDERVFALRDAAERAVARLGPRSTPAERDEADGAVARLAEAVDIARRVRALARGD